MRAVWLLALIAAHAGERMWIPRVLFRTLYPQTAQDELLLDCERRIGQPVHAAALWADRCMQERAFTIGMGSGGTTGRKTLSCGHALTHGVRVEDLLDWVVERYASEIRQRLLQKGR